MTGRFTMLALSAYFIYQLGQAASGIFAHAALVLATK